MNTGKNAEPHHKVYLSRVKVHVLGTKPGFYVNLIFIILTKKRRLLVLDYKATKVFSKFQIFKCQNLKSRQNSLKDRGFLIFLMNL